MLWWQQPWLSVQGLVITLGLSTVARKIPGRTQEWSLEKTSSLREEVRALWYHGYDNYLTYAFPLDEGRGPDWDDPSNYGFNDVNGNFSVTLVDVLDSFVTLNDPRGFDDAVRKVIQHVSFDVDTKPQVCPENKPYLDIWNEAYAAIMNHSRGADGYWYKAVNAYTGEVSQAHIDSLGAFWPGLQVLAGDVENAIKSHLVYWNLWRRFSAIPETFNIVSKEGITLGYPLRPEFIESTYFLYRATKDPFYLSVGERVLRDLIARNKAPCGMATLSNSVTGEQEDRMESFALSETLKYLYLLFDEENPLHTLDSNFVFTTEGHVLPLPRRYLRRSSSATGSSKKDAKGSKAPDTCPAPPSRLMPSWSDRNHTTGLTGLISDRPDTDYARHLVGLALDAPEVAEDVTHWRLEGICDAPRYDTHPATFVLTAYGEEAPEDPNPGPEKLALNADGTGVTVYNVSGIQLKAITRVDGRGYDIVQIGRHKIKSSQKVWFADPRLLKSDTPQNSSSYVDPYQKQLVPLRFFAESTKPKATPAQKILHTLFGDAEYTVSGVSATWGDQPGQKLEESEWDPNVSSRPRARLGKGSQALQLVRPPEENRHGCQPHIPPDFEQGSHFSPPQIYADSVLLLDRGGCTFIEKTQFAEQSGARSVIVLSDEDVLPSMTSSDPDYDFVQMYIKYISFIIIGGKDHANKLNEMLSQTDSRIMVEVDRTKPTGLDLVEAAKSNSNAVPKRMRSDWDRLRRLGVGRPLFINGKRLFNASLLF
ncbi:glycoside hydrolase family 47 protein [Tulasnella calospora MUT 4182]|uniref:Glycoside hydrolase family 47 protein n=1 Tax=Tulasnella calospora MUT 4182 TaxID=1051891 RepID=A0A0C3QM37_9AGAM|nr:glycoside hydrolase family 47 protein [Tulasnella calospora MUT 4182]